MPKISQYAGVKSLLLEIGTLSLWFSYQTVIAFKEGNNAIQVRQNDWSMTTGKHLNAIDSGNKKDRIESNTFETHLKAILTKNNLMSTTF